MKLLKRAYYTACSFLPPSVVKKISPVKTLLPYHHLVSDSELPHIRHLYSYKNVKQFRADLDFLLRHFNPVSVAQVIETLKKGNGLPANSFLLTFDDGLREVYEVIAPILMEKGVPAIFFINPAFIDNKQLFYRYKISLVIEELSKRKDALKIGKQVLGMDHNDFDGLKSALKQVNQLNRHIPDQFAERLNYSFDEFLKEKKPFLTYSQVRDLNDQGFTIGSHSWDHPYYGLLSSDPQLWQTLSSVSYLNEMMPLKYNCFSFPHSDAVLSQEFFDRLNQSDIKIDLLFGIQNQKSEVKNKVL